ncbi:hypothetical protein KIPB_001322 [Kipferlia bialata]|uniref:Uncharacterized protein n=1 Tax=Kipferlia bialata TaxID=797122 RepID=A0A9K3CQF9_9EUKA|nr:hypothetical protein KIPB_000751 [Kipferlia bialata]GIQ80512.1 hypothetical protein KIPB_001322 [Kipferlia bialata]|eukprot:g751.t1
MEPIQCMFCSELIPTTELVTHTRECRKHHIRVTNSVAREHLARYEAEVKRTRAREGFIPSITTTASGVTDVTGVTVPPSPETATGPRSLPHSEKKGAVPFSLSTPIDELDAILSDSFIEKIEALIEDDTRWGGLSLDGLPTQSAARKVATEEGRHKSRPRPISPFRLSDCEGPNEEALKEELDALFHDDVTRRLAGEQETDTLAECASISAECSDPKREGAEAEEQTPMQHFAHFNPEMSERVKALTERVKAMDIEALSSALDSLEACSQTALQEKLAALQTFMSEHTLEKVVSEDCGALVASLSGLCTEFHASLQAFISQRDHSEAPSSIVEAQGLVASLDSIGLIPLPRDTMSLSLPDKVKYVVVEDYNDDVRGVLRLATPLIACCDRIQHCIGVRGGTCNNHSQRGVNMTEWERVRDQSDSLLKTLAKLAPLQKQGLQRLEEYKATPTVSDSDIECAEYDVLVAEVAAKNPRMRREDQKTEAVTQVERYQKKVRELKHSQAKRERLQDEMGYFLAFPPVASALGVPVVPVDTYLGQRA